VAAMRQGTQQVSAATADQLQGGEQVAAAIGNISRVSCDLHEQARNLLEAIAFFKEEEQPSSGALPVRSVRLLPAGR